MSVKRIALDNVTFNNQSQRLCKRALLHITASSSASQSQSSQINIFAGLAAQGIYPRSKCEEGPCPVALMAKTIR